MGRERSGGEKEGGGSIFIKNFTDSKRGCLRNTCCQVYYMERADERVL